VSYKLKKGKKKETRKKKEKNRHSNNIIQKYKDNVKNFDVSTLIQGKIS
jgi:hypothetical protein